ncbi:MAG: ATP-dependent Clp protease proteolytic subunit [Cytophagales bacterium]|jgi:ATP-dependent Clp protease protease subunit|nr:ATP-dependent Clp protease proteolytic subunit [Cytophagales bacterium]
MNFKSEFKNFAVKDQGIDSLTLEKHMERIESMTRSIIEERQTNFREIDVFSRLIADRIIFLSGEINENVANVIIAQLLFLSSVDQEKAISLYINSQGGVIHDGLGIYDTMQFINPNVSTMCIGLAASMAAVLLASGEKGKRFALPHSKILIHQPLGGVKGQATEMEITVKHVLTLKKEIYEILSKHSGKSYEDIERDSERDYWLSAEEAMKYGLIDKVLTKS